MTPRINTLAGVFMLLAGLGGSATAQVPSDVQKIVAVVNDEIISEYDVKERMQLITSTTGQLRSSAMVRMPSWMGQGTGAGSAGGTGSTCANDNDKQSAGVARGIPRRIIMDMSTA